MTEQNYVKLEYVHHTLQEVISDSKKMGDHLIDLDMVERSLAFVEDVREAYFKERRAYESRFTEGY